MADWILVPCLAGLRNEFNQLAPGRDKASDGSIGDTRHAASSSDHNPDETGNTPYEDVDSKNEVHAIDVDDDLRKPGWTMTRALEIIITRHREGRDDRLQNVIYNRRIWSASWGWTARAYHGANAHTEHAHFSARYTTAQEADTRPWGLLEQLEDEMTKADFLSWLKDPEVRTALAVAVLNTDGVVPAPGNPKPGTNADGTAVNTHWGAGSYLQNAYAAAVSARTYAAAARDNAAALAPYAKAEAKEVPPSAEQNAAAVLDALAATGRPAEDLAAALRVALGDRAAEVGRMLAAA